MASYIRFSVADHSVQFGVPKYIAKRMNRNILLTMQTIILNEVTTIEQFCKGLLKMNNCQDQNDQLYIQLTMNFNLQNQKYRFPSQNQFSYFAGMQLKNLNKSTFSNSIIKRLFSKQHHETSNTQLSRIEPNRIKKRKSFLKDSLESRFRRNIYGELILNKMKNKNEISLGKFWNKPSERKQKRLILSQQQKKYQQTKFKDINRSIKMIDSDSGSNLIKESRSQNYLGILKYGFHRKQLLKKIKQQLGDKNYRSSNSLDINAHHNQKCNQAQKIQVRQKSKTLEIPFQKVIKSNVERFVLQKKHVMDNIKKCLSVSSSKIKLKIARNSSSKIFKQLKSRSGPKLKTIQPQTLVSDISFQPWIIQNTSTSFFN